MVATRPRIIILEHLKYEIENLCGMPVMREIAEKGMAVVTGILVEDLQAATEKVRNAEADVIISDIAFRTSTAKEWCEQLGKVATKMGIPIIVYSAHVDMPDMARMLSQCNVVGLIDKNEGDKNFLNNTISDLLFNKIGIPDPRPKKGVTWLHLSDLHFGSPHDRDRGKVEKAFFKDIKHFSDMGVSFHMIMVTGDIAWSGTEQEYKRAGVFLTHLLKETGVPAGRLFMVPGNHDASWSLIDPGARGVCSTFVDRNNLNDILSSPDSLALLFKPFQAYGLFRTSIGVPVVAATSSCRKLCCLRSRYRRVVFHRHCGI